MGNLKYIFLGLVFIFSHNSFAQSVLNVDSNWFMETRQETTSYIGIENSSRSITGDRWAHDNMNGAFISPNAWGFGGNAGGTGSDSGLSDAYVRWSMVNKNSKDYLQLKWFVGGYNRDFKGQPSHGWPNGGNNVKAYPRIGIGSASGQPNATSGTPNNVEPVTTGGTTTANLEKVSQQIGLPVRVSEMPEIDIHVDLQFAGGSNQVAPKDKYGNYFFAIDSYYHDIDTAHYMANNALVGSVNGINDSSGRIYNTDMRDLPETTKRWATMVWYHKPVYYASSGGYELSANEIIDGRSYTVKYKVENASDKLFKYISFIMNRETTELTNGGKQPVVRYKRFAEFLTDGRLQVLLDQHVGQIKDTDGVARRIIAPSTRMVLSDVNVGVEVLSNPDTRTNTTPAPVEINFNELYFEVSGKGSFGYKSGQASTPAQTPVPVPAPIPVPIPDPIVVEDPKEVEAPVVTEGKCIDTGKIGDGWGWNYETLKSCRVNVETVEESKPAKDRGIASVNDDCVDTGKIGDGWGWNYKTLKSCKIVNSNSNKKSNDNQNCVDTGVKGDGWGWDFDNLKSCQL